MIILRFQIQVNEGNSAKQELLDWIRSQIPSYNIQNFTTDWQSGRALCALAEAVKPGQMNLPHDFSSDPIQNCNLGFNKAKDNMRIPMILDAEDMVHAPDELANMTYLSYFRDYWNSMMSKLAWPENCSFMSFTCHVQAANKAGAKKEEGGDAFAAAITGGGHNVPAKVLDNGNGTYAINYSLPGPGQYSIAVTLQNRNIKGSPFTQIVH